MSYPLPKNEEERLRALRSYKILDTKPEDRFDELTELAAIICGVPISLMSLIDADRQWFKSKVGLEMQETPRAQAFCTHAIMQPGMFVVPDASKDDRFAQNPLVTGDTHIRFYAGAPLVSSDGHVLGTMCVIDREPRELTEEQLRALRILSRQVVYHMEMRSNLAELKAGLKAREQASGPSGDAAAGLDEIIAGLEQAIGALRAVRAGR
jgi:GAF domain-containing protein